jgi:hypothetical protein
MSATTTFAGLFGQGGRLAMPRSIERGCSYGEEKGSCTRTPSMTWP